MSTEVSTLFRPATQRSQPSSTPWLGSPSASTPSPAIVQLWLSLPKQHHFYATGQYIWEGNLDFDVPVSGEASYLDRYQFAHPNDRQAAANWFARYPTLQAPFIRLPDLVNAVWGSRLGIRLSVGVDPETGEQELLVAIAGTTDPIADADCLWKLMAQWDRLVNAAERNAPYTILVEYPTP